MSLRSTVVSLVPFDIIEEKPGLVPPRFYIPASVNEVPQLLYIDTTAHFVYLDDTRGSLQVKDPSDITARAIVEDYLSSQMGIDDVACPALFWIPEDISLDDVIKKYKVQIVQYKLRQKQWLINVCKIADNDWQRYHQHNVISAFQRKAADIIGWNHQQHEWMSPLTTMEASACPACGFSIVKGTIICSNCRCVIDKVKYSELQFA